jgi:hypothetical protein
MSRASPGERAVMSKASAGCPPGGGSGPVGPPPPPRRKVTVSGETTWRPEDCSPPCAENKTADVPSVAASTVKMSKTPTRRVRRPRLGAAAGVGAASSPCDMRGSMSGGGNGDPLWPWVTRPQFGREAQPCEVAQPDPHESAVVLCSSSALPAALVPAIAEDTSRGSREEPTAVLSIIRLS